jgi:CheY-like chemotaxis protein
MARVLLVDDNLETLDSRRESIAEAGHEVRTAESVDAALEALPADWVVADLRIPEVEDGLRLIREVTLRAPEAQIIVSTGFSGYLQGRAERSMVQHILQKPYPTSRLLSLLRVLVAILCAGSPVQAADAIVERHAPILERRANATGTPSDVPLMMYAEKLRDGSGDYLQYTVIFSNEDGGTSTPALLARWGRTTDIEHVYRVWVNGRGERVRATIQTKDHKDVDYAGPFEGDRPLLAVITDNNMVGPGDGGGERAVLQPVVVDLSQGSREVVMDSRPELYRIASEELAREGKVRGLVGDAREYLYIEAKIANSNTRLAGRVRAGDRWLSSHLGRTDWAIERSGWVRMAVRLPAGTRAEELGFECLAERGKEPGRCVVERVGRVFVLDGNYRPGANRTLGPFRRLELEPGEARTWKLR